MPEISLFGWFHTIIAIIGILAGIYSLVKFKLIRIADLSGKVYLLCTFLAAASALGIYQNGGFNPAHVLAILTLLALAVGAIAEKTQVFGKLSAYVMAMSFSATLLFHMIPAITDGLMRLPVSDPVVKEIEDPLLRGFYLAFLVTYIIGFACQCLWLRKQASK